MPRACARARASSRAPLHGVTCPSDTPKKRPRNGRAGAAWYAGSTRQLPAGAGGRGSSKFVGAPSGCRCSVRRTGGPACRGAGDDRRQGYLPGGGTVGPRDVRPDGNPRPTFATCAPVRGRFVHRRRYPSGSPMGRSGHPTGRFRMAALTCPRCGHAEWRYAGMLREAPGRQAVAWRCVSCNWPRLIAPADVRPVPCVTCQEMNRAPRFADYFTCWNCGEDSPVA